MICVVDVIQEDCLLEQNYKILWKGHADWTFLWYVCCFGIISLVVAKQIKDTMIQAL